MHFKNAAAMLAVTDFQHTPNPIAQHYSNFQVEKRLLLTGHSHQAWPDVAYEGLTAAWRDAATHLDDKWQLAFDQAKQVKQGFARLLNDNEGDYALAENSHTLIVRFLSALDLKNRPRLVTSDSEFHSIRRQLDRLAEEGIEVIRVASQPYESFTERLAAQVNANTAAVLLSSVFYSSAQICNGLSEVMSSCSQQGAEFLVDAYHHLNVVPFDIAVEGLQQAFIIGGGYKYCQLGEGNCFLRVPPGCKMRPVITGWFGEFKARDELTTHLVHYTDGGQRFAGATYDPVSHYRAARVFNFFIENELNPLLLRQINQHQVALLLRRFDALDLPPADITRDHSIPPQQRGGFVALHSPHAATLCKALHAQQLFCDSRGEILRLGPAPYLSDEQLHHAMDLFSIVVRKRDF